ncbi:hypothetical protein Gasu_14600 isoform 2 [Galdieria sulphuraria]|uniref:Uncharacterized protein n=1 Tax=Galdieria sulphuraria TaxID=130081 RepID=M2Y5T0_GALSU|nr:hypothetical protein Gasu_14600 isoform 2 [Galdieria sulphuraria]EME31214.1 hypothetical protein isoform 2 [Galdieria sulphuraria]|eukprot:XP_005707734.1 hypothetical protein isoform 2 [Galdieria sulphuraria]
MFGLGVPSCPIFTQFQQVQPEKFVAQFPAKFLGSSFLFFLLPGASLPANTVASLYWSVPPYENWSFVGLIGNDCPSKLCTLKLPAQSASENVMIEVSTMENILFSITWFKLGISIENMSEAALAVPNSPTIVLDQSDLQLLVRGIATDFFRFVESFGQSMGPGGLALVDKWFQKFQEKLQSDPWYWRRISDRT